MDAGALVVARSDPGRACSPVVTEGRRAGTRRTDCWWTRRAHILFVRHDAPICRPCTCAGRSTARLIGVACQLSPSARAQEAHSTHRRARLARVFLPGQRRVTGAPTTPPAHYPHTSPPDPRGDRGGWCRFWCRSTVGYDRSVSNRIERVSRRRSARTREKRAQSSDFSGSWMGLLISGSQVRSLRAHSVFQGLVGPLPRVSRRFCYHLASTSLGHPNERLRLQRRP